MLYREIIAVCSEIHTKHINTLSGQNVELLNVKLVVCIVTTGLWRGFFTINTLLSSYDAGTRLFRHLLIDIYCLIAAHFRL